MCTAEQRIRQQGLGNWAEAERCFGKAAALAPSFSFAAADRTLALYQLGKTEEAIRWANRQACVAAPERSGTCLVASATCTDKPTQYLRLSAADDESWSCQY